MEATPSIVFFSPSKLMPFPNYPNSPTNKTILSQLGLSRHKFEFFQSTQVNLMPALLGLHLEKCSYPKELHVFWQRSPSSSMSSALCMWPNCYCCHFGLKSFGTKDVFSDLTPASTQMEPSGTGSLSRPLPIRMTSWLLLNYDPGIHMTLLLQSYFHLPVPLLGLIQDSKTEW